ncbi:hypothetical protein P7K49_035004 [Saguinus oedipus]|uniref:RNA-binding protein 38 n=1 Tax=Saguinus oedipus TaxID=9490 RepID=A0ABQ9TWC6_SAGOE|nr:hypothetical protein P7K49_035004 [Saguinus oedipus]
MRRSQNTKFTRIFVGSLRYRTTDASLRKYFEDFGDIKEAVVIFDPQTGKSRGYGFVTMANQAAAQRACEDPHPVIDGRKTNVNLAYLGAKPPSLQTGFAIGVPQLHPTSIQRTYGLTPQDIHLPVTVQPSTVILAAPVTSLSQPYMEYTPASRAYTQYPPATYNRYSPGTYAQYPLATYNQHPLATYTQHSPTTFTQHPLATYAQHSPTQHPPATYAQHSPTTYTQHPSATYARHSPTTYARHSPTTYAQHSPTTYTQHPPATYARHSPTTYAQHSPTTYTQHSPTTYAQYLPATYVQYPLATYAQHPYSAQPTTAAGFAGYSYRAAVPQVLSAATPGGTIFVQYLVPQLQLDRMQ